MKKALGLIELSFMHRLPLLPGDPIPDFTYKSATSQEFKLSSMAGKYILLFFFGSAQLEIVDKVLKFITKDYRHHFDDKKLSFLGISVDTKDIAKLKDMVGINYCWDFDLKISSKLKLIEPEQSKYYPLILIIDPLQRVIANIPLVDPDKSIEDLKKAIDTLPELDLYAGTAIHAPVLILPRVFDYDLCKHLISLYDERGGKPSGFMVEKDGNTVMIMNDYFKRRQDHTLDKDDKDKDLCALIRRHLNQRLVPEIQKAFQFKATMLERYLIACYDTKGFFNPHRDNTTKGTAHRRFAVTINLNSEDYDGGDLRFPEFGTRTYRAPTGGAIIFSCSLLHEATNVTKGKRYAFLPFLYDDEAAKIREANLKYLESYDFYK